MEKTQHILIAPLNWGLGHATRCVPLIRHYVENGDRVTLAAYGNSADYLHKEFPDLEVLDFPGMEIKYPKNDSMFWSMLRQTPSLLKAIRHEHFQLQKMIDENNIDVVISDNRYGLYSAKAHCIFITHQLFVPAGIFSGIINRKNHRYISRFNECWVPDFEGEPNLSGKLSHGNALPKNVKYISPLSRFDHPCNKKENFNYDYCIILSGPQPQKNILDNLLRNKLNGSEKRCAFINSSQAEIHSENITFFPTQTTENLFKLINDSAIVITRSGYSSVMDLFQLNKAAILIPTPGQPEQEYLAQLHQNKFRILEQKQIEDFSF